MSLRRFLAGLCLWGSGIYLGAGVAVLALVTWLGMVLVWLSLLGLGLAGLLHLRGDLFGLSD